jgi:large subunit ribosomal protein L29
MQVAELIGKTPDELRDMIAGLRKELFNIRFQRAAGETGAQGRAREAKKDIARILTVINGGAEAPKAEKAAKKTRKPKAEKKAAEKAARAQEKAAKAEKKAKAKTAEKPAKEPKAKKPVKKAKKEA